MKSAALKQAETAPVGLVLADGHPIVLQGMERLFQAEGDLAVLATCTSDAETIAAIQVHKPEVLMLDLRLPSGGGLAMLRELASLRLPMRVVLLATAISETEMVDAVRLGVSGVVLKEMAPRFFVQCIRHVQTGAMWFENRLFGAAVERMARSQPTLLEGSQRLTPRELEVARLVANGLRNKEITERLSVSEGTVKIHLHNIYEKLGTNDRVKLALRVRSEGLA